EEQMRGWLDEIRRRGVGKRKAAVYQHFATLGQFFQRWKMRAFDARAAAELKRLRTEAVRIGTQYLKIASIALVSDAQLLSNNHRDFSRVTGLRVESWLE